MAVAANGQRGKPSAAHQAARRRAGLESGGGAGGGGRGWAESNAAEDAEKPKCEDAREGLAVGRLASPSLVLPPRRRRGRRL